MTVVGTGTAENRDRRDFGFVPPSQSHPHNSCSQQLTTRAHNNSQLATPLLKFKRLHTTQSMQYNTMIAPTLNMHATTRASPMSLRPQGLHLESPQDSCSFKMAHRQMRPSGMHFAPFPHYAGKDVTDDADCDTDSTSSDSDYSDDSSSVGTRTTALPTNTAEEDNASTCSSSTTTTSSSSNSCNSWEDRAVIMERTVVSDLLGGTSRESLHMGGRWSYKSQRRPRNRSDTSWIKN